jgi:transketolase N-terminal domain/subunit
MGDGEMQEGANLEAMAAIHRLRVRNVRVVVDNNGMQAMQDTPVLNLCSVEWVKTYKGESWRCHYENAK